MGLDKQAVNTPDIRMKICYFLAATVGLQVSAAPWAMLYGPNRFLLWDDAIDRYGLAFAKSCKATGKGVSIAECSVMTCKYENGSDGEIIRLFDAQQYFPDAGYDDNCKYTGPAEEAHCMNCHCTPHPVLGALIGCTGR